MIALARGDRLVMASHNQGKLRELAELVAPFGLSVVSVGELGLPEPDETGTTFEENAQLKAVAAATASGLTALADDSGLAVAALGGAPGVYTADWAGPDRNYPAAMKSVADKLAALGATELKDRGAAFISVLCLASPAGEVEFFRGEVNGSITWPPRGPEGFGYDPIFIPEGHERTFGEMSRAEKQTMSHRARAFRKFAEAKLA